MTTTTIETTMTSTETNTIPHEASQIRERVLELPLVSNTYNSLTSLAAPISPYMEGPMTSLTTGCSTIKSLAEDQLLPHLPETVNNYISSTAEKANTAMSSLDSMACSNLEHLVEKVPALKQTGPELYQSTSETVTTRGHQLAVYLASFTMSQVFLKITDSSLSSMDSLVRLVGIQDSNLAVVALRKVHSGASTVRQEGARINGTQRVLRMEKLSVLGVLAEVTGILSVLGLRLQEVTEEETDNKQHKS